MGEREVYDVCDALSALVDLNQGQRFLLAILAKYVGLDGYAEPSVGRLAQDLRIGGRTVQHRLRQLEELGYIETVRRVGEDGGCKTNAYRLSRRLSDFGAANGPT
jgi:DNA-binding transcriptional ArsR family regulator